MKLLLLFIPVVLYLVLYFITRDKNLQFRKAIEVLLAVLSSIFASYFLITYFSEKEIVLLVLFILFFVGSLFNLFKAMLSSN